MAALLIYDELGKDLEGSGRGPIEVLSQHLHEGRE
jgi:hypothetical protein